MTLTIDAREGEKKENKINKKKKPNKYITKIVNQKWKRQTIASYSNETVKIANKKRWLFNPKIIFTLHKYIYTQKQQ